MKEKIVFSFIEKGEYAPREGVPFVKRENIAAIIKYERQYLFLSWNETNYNNSLVTGGVDKNENYEDAVKREVMEETGYYDIKSITKVDCVNVSKFFVEHKKQNREAVYYPYLVELKSLSKNEIADFEKREHTCFWVDADKLDQVQLFENHRMMLEKAI